MRGDTNHTSLKKFLSQQLLTCHILLFETSCIWHRQKRLECVKLRDSFRQQTAFNKIFTSSYLPLPVYICIYIYICVCVCVYVRVCVLVRAYAACGCVQFDFSASRSYVTDFFFSFVLRLLLYFAWRFDKILIAIFRCRLLQVEGVGVFLTADYNKYTCVSGSKYYTMKWKCTESSHHIVIHTQNKCCLWIIYYR